MARIAGLFLSLALWLCISSVTFAEMVPTQSGENGQIIIKTSLPFHELEQKLAAAIAGNGMNIVNRASASDGAKARGLLIAGDAVIGVFRNDFAVRMLAANVDAGIEAPVRFHLSEDSDGKASIRYSPPSVAFGRYSGDAIKQVGRDLDPIFAKIIAETMRP